MTWWQGLVVGVVQGLTEFLPVSSSGHLVVAQAALGMSAPGILVEVTVHVATLLAVVVVYRRTLWHLTVGVVHGDRAAWQYVMLVVVASIPAAVVGLTLKDFFESAFDSLLLVGVNFIVTGFILWSTRGTRTDNPQTAVGMKHAVGMGLAQAFAILPGISRSGSTVAVGLWGKVDPIRAAEFSFIMSIPTILGAAILQVPDVGTAARTVGTVSLVAAFVSALLAGILAIRLLIRLLTVGAFYRFAAYCWTMGVLTIGAWTILR